MLAGGTHGGGHMLVVHRTNQGKLEATKKHSRLKRREWRSDSDKKKRKNKNKE